MSDIMNQTIATFDKYQMSSYVAGPIYSAWLFRVNNTLINTVSRLVRFPDADGIEHMPWEQDVSDDVKAEIANWLGVRNSIIDAIENLDGSLPPSSFENTYDYLLRNNPEDNERNIKQTLAMEYINRVKRGDKLHSTVQQYVEDNYAKQVRSYASLRDTRDNVLSYLENATYVKDRSAPLAYNNLPDWFEDMVYTVGESKFAKLYKDKLCMLDRSLSPTTRKAVETEIFLMEQAAEELKYELPEITLNQPLDSAYLASLGITA